MTRLPHRIFLQAGVATRLHKFKQHHQTKWNERSQGRVTIWGNRCELLLISGFGF
jgi:hypothetical protein